MPLKVLGLTRRVRSSGRTSSPVVTPKRRPACSTVGRTAKPDRGWARSRTTRSAPCQRRRGSARRDQAEPPGDRFGGGEAAGARAWRGGRQTARSGAGRRRWGAARRAGGQGAREDVKLGKMSWRGGQAEASGRVAESSVAIDPTQTYPRGSTRTSPRAARPGATGLARGRRRSSPQVADAPAPTGALRRRRSRWRCWRGARR